MTDPLAVVLMLPGLTNLDLSQNNWSPSEEFAAVLTSKPELRVSLEFQQMEALVYLDC